MFFQCESLERVRLPETVKEIQSSAFAGCTRLADLRFPPALQKIGSSAFAGCGFRDLALPDAVTVLESSAFKGCRELETVVLPPDITYLPEGVFARCGRLRSVVLPAHLEATSSFHYLYDRLDGGIALSGYGAFQYCSALKSVVIPAGVRRIGFGTFWHGDCSPAGPELIFEEGFQGIVETETWTDK